MVVLESTYWELCRLTIGFHNLRATAVSLLHEVGIPQATVKKWVRKRFVAFLASSIVFVASYRVSFSLLIVFLHG